MKKNHLILYAILVVLSAAILIFASLHDHEWSLYLSQKNLPIFSKFMGQSFYEKKMWGGSDFGVTFGILCAFIYLAIQIWPALRNHPHFQKLRHFTAYVTVSSLFVGLGLVHLTKLAIGRGRPFEVLGEEAGRLSYSFPWQFGPHSIYDGLFSGSFPSGHTMTVLILLTISIYGRRLDDFYLVRWTNISGFFAILLTVFMSFGRIMSLDHWPSDVVGSILLSLWGLIGIDHYMNKNKLYEPNLPFFAEILACKKLLLFFVAIFAFLFGLRGISYHLLWALFFFTLSALSIGLLLTKRLK